jgi:putative ABC transport system permease protein
VRAFSSLDRKLIREIWRMKAQVLAVAMVIASGTALLIMALTTIEALEETRDAYYERTRFADVFAGARRAPERLAAEIAAIPGVRMAQTRIVEVAMLDISGFREPVIGQILSLPEHGPQLLNVLVLRSGRLAEPNRPDEVVVSEPFAEAHGLDPGDSFGAILEGRKRTLQVVGTALSPEFVYAIAPGGLMPDDERFGVLWMGRAAMAAAYDMDGAFNSVTLGLLRGADPNEIIPQLDALLDTYGGAGAVARAEQLSNWFLQNEIDQQKNMSTLLPAIFLAVAVFLTNMVMVRLIQTERHEIGLLKAFGYTDLAIGWHYAKLVLLIGGIGVGLGTLMGAWLGHFQTGLYADFFHFPFLLYRPGPSSFLLAGGISLAAALAGSLAAVRQAVGLPPAEAMLPPSPPVYRRNWLSRSILRDGLDEPTRMILRRILRWPLRAFLASAGVAMSVAVLVLALQWLDAVDHLVESVFEQGQHQDATIGFVDIRPASAERSFAGLPGVLTTEPFRNVAARLHNGHLSLREGIGGVPSAAMLSPVHDFDLGPVPVPEDGLLMSRIVAEHLEVGVGDVVRVEVLEGRRPVLELPVVRIFDTYIGRPVHMELSALNRVMGDGRVIDGLHVTLDSGRRDEFLAEVKELPGVAGVLFRRAAIDQVYETIGETMYIFVGFFVAFAAVLAVGVTYNSARIALSERARELATLRVLGFGRWEISYILLGEIGLLTWLALPFGCAVGFGLAWYIAGAFETELFRVPLIIADATYGKAVLIALAATAAAAAIVRRRLDHLDLIAVLKTRE